MDSGIEAIIFDLNGVLVNGEKWHERAFTMAMKDFGYEVTPNLKKKGYSTLSRLVELRKMGRAPSNIEDIVKRKREYAEDILKKECGVVDRVINAVAFSHKIMKGKIAVSTNCSRHSAISMLERSGLLPFFDTIITSDDTGGKLKPHPYPYLVASYKLGVFYKKCLAIDDSDIGITSAVNAMCRTLKLNSFENLNAEMIKKELKLLEIRI